ncbi:NAD-dependent aldehyde dehydrogenase [Mycena sanguinolenta]|uniref:NAD-dependent aldehyde dehydrogenase n=1 Tax=Mycena sanguinolenta TaxID=230812 RepID=A0A8H7CHG3_9AGAR|nr:NAD-dependent aldehyde dehydrogenase [Mycena sanguinolenta]
MVPTRPPSTTGKLLTQISEATPQDVEIAVKAAQVAFDTTWGLNASGAKRGELLYKLGSLMDAAKDELAALEALDNGKTFGWATLDLDFSIGVVKYYAGWADKITGQTIETDEKKLAYTRHEPIGVVVSRLYCWSIHHIDSVFTRAKSSHGTFLASLKLQSTHSNSYLPSVDVCLENCPCSGNGKHYRLEALGIHPAYSIADVHHDPRGGFPPGVVNVITGYGNTVGAAISSHMGIFKVAFTGSTIVGRKIMEAAAKSNLKPVTLELGGKSPNIIFDDADLDKAVEWTAHGLYWNHGAACCASSRIFVQSGIYDKFLEKFTERSKAVRIGDPLSKDIDQGPMSSEAQFNRIMGYIESGKKDGATVHLGGDRFGTEGYYVNPTIFTNTTPDMKIAKEEIFGPVGVIIKFENEDDVVRQANDTLYGLAAGVFSQDIDRAIRTAHRVQAGTIWVNCYNHFNVGVPFGGYRQSGIGRELGEYALHHYTNVKAVHINLGHRM